MWKPFILSLILSILVVCIPSAALAFILAGSFAGSFIYYFVAFTVFLWSIIGIIKSIIQNKAEMYSKLSFVDERNEVTITCPCQQNTFKMHVYPNSDNEYTCDVCKNSFYIKCVLDPIMQTQPMNLENTYKIFQQLVEKGKTGTTIE
jgi:hypothetical protein